MKIVKTETIKRYQVQFTPREMQTISTHRKWGNRVGRRFVGWRGGDATLTKQELNEVCDVLGINGREFMERYRD